MKKYSKYIAIAAAVIVLILIIVLVCVNLPKNETQQSENRVVGDFDFGPNKSKGYTYVVVNTNCDYEGSDVKNILQVYTFDKTEKCIDERVKFNFVDETTAQAQYESWQQSENNYELKLENGAVSFNSSSSIGESKDDVIQNIKQSVNENDENNMVTYEVI